MNNIYPYKNIFLALFLGFFILFPIQSNSTENKAETLYLDNCAICHGNQGEGGIGVPLALDDFLRSASTKYLKQSIRLGRPGRVMPSFYWMSENDINSIIEHIGSWRKTPAPLWATHTIQGSIQNGKDIFKKKCAVCHGGNGKGGKGSGTHFSRPQEQPITAPALNNQGLLHSATDSMLQFIIKQGRQGTPMPAAKTLGLNSQDIDDLVSYIRQFQQSILTKTHLYDDEPASLIVDSTYSYKETIENVKRAIVGSNFVHIRDQSLIDGLKVETSPNSKQTMIYFCNFSFLYESLKIDPRVGMFLPCRITVTEYNDKVQIMSINPKHLSQLFNNDELNESCDQMYKVYSDILEDASL